jgi:outer membrane receptor protein involved in Fe transport
LPLALPAFGQVARGNITGTVSDTNGARIPEAKITIGQAETGLTRSLATNTAGDFSANLLPIGTYTVTVARAGFDSNVTRDILLTVDKTVTLNIVLQIGRVTQSVTVNAKPALLDPMASSLGQLVGNMYMQDLPLNGRNPYTLGLLSGNVVPTIGGGAGNQPFVAGGARYTANNFLVDGVINTNYQQSIVYFPSVDAVQEYKVQTSTYSAEFGNAAGVVVNLVTKSGTNQFHGSAYDYVRNEKLDANDFFSNAASKPIAPYKRNQFGFSLGGPLGIHPRAQEHSTFFFFSYEGLRQRQAAFGGIANVAPVAFRQGNFSSLIDAKGNLIPIYDPATRALGSGGVVTDTAFAGNIIPTQRISSVSQAIMALIPAPNFGAASAQARNYTRTAPTPSDSGNYDARIDHNFSSSNTAFLRFSGQNAWSTNNGILPPPLAGGQGINRPRDASINFVHIFSPSVVNSVQFAATRLSSSTVGASQNTIIPGLAKWPFAVQGLPGIVVNSTGARSGSNEFDSIGDAGSFLSITNGFEWTDNLTIVKGHHTFKTGADLYRPRLDFIGGSDFFGNMYFGPIYTSNPTVLNSGAPFADFLLGLPSSADGSQYLNWAHFRQIYSGGYFQDNWKVTQRLTLNLGLRYDIWTVPIDAKNVGGLLDVKTGRIALPGQNGYSRGIINGDHNNFAPRFGFAYQVNPKMVVRGGYGFYYAQQEKTSYSGFMAGEAPNIPLLSFPVVNPSTTVTPPATISSPIASVPFDTTLSGFSASHPWALTLYTSNFTNNPAQYVQQFNLNYQYQPWADWLFELSYSGSLGRKLSGRINLNQEPWQNVLNGTNTQAYRFAPFLNGVLCYDGAYGTSNYNAVNLKVQKSFSRGLQFLVNYTYSRNFELGTPGVVSTWTQAGGTSLPLDSYNMLREYGPAVTDLPHYLVASFVYNLPFGPGQHFLDVHGPVGKVLGGWQINGITTRRSGTITDLRYGPHVTNFSTINVPDRVSGQSLEVSNPSVNQWFNPAAFAPAPTALANNGTQQVLFGNLAQRVGRGPGGFDLDFSLFKNFPVTERVRLQFRAEAFNLTNTPTFGLPVASSPNLTYGSTVFGQLSSASSVGRQIQLALRLDF